MSAHRAKTRRNVRLAQISALGMVALTGLLFALPPSGASTPAPPLVDPDAPGQPVASDTPPPLDLSGAVEALSTRVQVQEIIRPPTPAGDPITQEPPPTEPATPFVEGPPHFRYICAFLSPRRSYAIITTDDGVSRGITVGDRIGDYMLLGISPNRLVFEHECTLERHDYFIEPRPDQPPAYPDANAFVDSEALADDGNGLGYDPAANQSGYKDGSEIERERRATLERLKEMQQRKDAATRMPTSPPQRPAAKPATPASRNPATNKDVK